MVNQNNDSWYDRDQDISPEKRQGSGAGGGPLNEDIERKLDPYKDYSSQRGRNHELPRPSDDDFKYLFGDED